MDELHDLKIEYETYFGEMDLSDEEKRDRLELAKQLEPIFLYLFFMILEESASIEDYTGYLISEYKRIATRFIKSREPTAYLNDYINDIAPKIINVTLDNLGSEYYTSVDRAMTLAANEANTIGNYREYAQKVKQGYKYKTWVSMRDEKVRITHALINGDKVGIFDSFHVGAYEMMFPRDASLGAGAEEIVNCRCTVRYTKT